MYRFDNFFRDTAFSAAMADYPILAIDVGARGGFEADLLPVAFAVDAVGFEPEPAAFAHLSGVGPWKSLRYAPIALSGSGGWRRLNVTRDPTGATLLEPNQKFGSELDKQQFFEVVRTIELKTETLDDAVSQLGISRVDYLKIDIEGAELEVLVGGAKTLEGLLALKTEVMFAPVRHQQPFAADMDSMLRAKGFRLMEIIRPAVWRRHGYIVHPQFGREAIPYSKGQLIHGDYLFFREPEKIESHHQALRMSFVALAYGFFDFAECLLARPDVHGLLKDQYGLRLGEEMKRASSRFGRRIWMRELVSHLRGIAPFIRSFARMMASRF